MNIYGLKRPPKKRNYEFIMNTEPKIAPCGLLFYIFVFVRIYTQTAKYNLNKGCFFLNIPSDYLFYYKIIIYPFKYAGRRSSIFFAVFIAKKKGFSLFYIRKVNYKNRKQCSGCFIIDSQLIFFVWLCFGCAPARLKLFKM